MKFCCLGSGSGGNAFVVEHRATTVLADCGFGYHQLKDRLQKSGISNLNRELNAVLIGHEHHDHSKSARRFVKHPGISLYMTAGTADALEIGNARIIRSGELFYVNDLPIMPITVPHDAAEPVQFVFGEAPRKIGIFTDLGRITLSLREACADLSAIALECNYDKRMLAANRKYPADLKRRIAGGFGHLDNDTAAAFIAEIDSPRLKHVLGVHLSRHNNSVDLVKEALGRSCDARKVVVAVQEEGTGWLEV